MIDIATAFGLSSSAGLNAYIPLLIVSLTAKYTNWIQLGDPWQDTLTSWWVIGILTVLLLIEMFVDKIPAVDSINDVIQTVGRPAAGAILFAAETGTIEGMSPVLAVIAGLLLAGTVHGAKSLARPAVTASTAGTANWAVSIVEDVLSVIGTVLAILLPVLVVLVVVFLLAIFGWWWFRRRRTQALAS